MLSGARQGQAQVGPQGDGPLGAGQHVHPALQGLTGALGTQQHLALGLGPELRAMGPDGQYQIHTPGRGRWWCGGGRERQSQLGPGETLPTSSFRQPTWIWLKGTWKVKASLK